MPKPLTVWITINCEEFWKRWEYQVTRPVSWEIYIQVKEQQLKLDMNNDWFQLGKGVHQGYILSLFLFNLYAESVQFSHSVVSNSLGPDEPQHARPPCPSPTPGVHSNSCPLNRWCRPAISSSVIPFSSCPQSLPTSESFDRKDNLLYLRCWRLWGEGGGHLFKGLLPTFPISGG